MQEAQNVWTQGYRVLESNMFSKQMGQLMVFSMSKSNIVLLFSGAASAIVGTFCCCGHFV